MFGAALERPKKECPRKCFCVVVSGMWKRPFGRLLWYLIWCLMIGTASALLMKCVLFFAGGNFCGCRIIILLPGVSGPRAFADVRLRFCKECSGCPDGDFDLLVFRCAAAGVSGV